MYRERERGRVRSCARQLIYATRGTSYNCKTRFVNESKYRTSAVRVRVCACTRMLIPEHAKEAQNAYYYYVERGVVNLVLHATVRPRQTFYRVLLFEHNYFFALKTYVMKRRYLCKIVVFFVFFFPPFVPSHEHVYFKVNATYLHNGKQQSTSFNAKRQP